MSKEGPIRSSEQKINIQGRPKEWYKLARRYGLTPFSLSSIETNGTTITAVIRGVRVTALMLVNEEKQSYKGHEVILTSPNGIAMKLDGELAHKMYFKLMEILSKRNNIGFEASGAEQDRAVDDVNNVVAILYNRVTTVTLQERQPLARIASFFRSKFT